MIVVAPESFNWHGFDPRVLRADRIGAQSSGHAGLWVLTVQTFKPFSELLVKMAREAPSCTILQVSNQYELQVRVEIPREMSAQTKETVLAGLENSDGCALNFEFAYPKIGDSDSETQLSLTVKAPALLRVLGYCMKHGLRIVQVYDFYG